MAFACCFFGKSRKFHLVEEDPDFVLSQLKRFSFHELQVATDGFSDKNILSKGINGPLYRGQLQDGSHVAVKRIEKGQTRAKLQFQREIKVSTLTADQNVLRLHGFCSTPNEGLLVYPFMVNGSVASWLRGHQVPQTILNWQVRRQIAMESARGVAHLHHCNPKVIHRNLKASEILLDEKFRAVVGGLGWAKLMNCEDDEALTIVCGTYGYIAPEYLHTGRCSDKSDVYAYGMMLLEIITGRTVFDLSRMANNDDAIILDWIKGFLLPEKLGMLVDPDLRGDYVETEAEELIQVALICTRNSPMDRPTMSEVVRLLQGDGLAERWNDYNEREMRHWELEQNLDRGSRWSFDSSESQYAEDLPGPR